MKGPKEVVILGASGHAKVVASTLMAAGWRIVGLYDDDPGKAGSEVLGIPVIGQVKDARPGAGVAVVSAIGRNQPRKRVAEAAIELVWATALHPTAWLDPTAVIGEGTVVFSGAIVQPGARIGRHCILNTGCSVDHDCTIGDYVHLAPGVHLAGNVHIGEGAFLGIGCKVIPGVRIGAWTQVGAGGIVVNDLPERVLALGVPAKAVRHMATEGDCG